MYPFHNNNYEANPSPEEATEDGKSRHKRNVNKMKCLEEHPGSGTTHLFHRTSTHSLHTGRAHFFRHCCACKAFQCVRYDPLKLTEISKHALLIFLGVGGQNSRFDPFECLRSLLQFSMILPSLGINTHNPNKRSFVVICSYSFFWSHL